MSVIKIEDVAYQNLDVSDLYQKFTDISKFPKNTQDSECQKLAIICAVEQHILNNASLSIQKKFSRRRIHDQKNSYAIAGYSILLTFGCFEKSIGSFLFGSTLFGLIPGISSVLLSIASIIYTLLDIFLFYAFEVSFLKRYMGISNAPTGEHLLNETYLQQLESINIINELLEHGEVQRHADYQKYADCKALFNQHLLQKYDSMADYPRSWPKAILEYALITFGAISSMADSYFMAKAAIVALHLSLMGPLGIGLALCMMLSGLIFYYVMGAKSVGKIVSPDYKSFKELKKGLSLFKEDYAPSLTSSSSPLLQSDSSNYGSCDDEEDGYPFAS